jgi:broad specificity phosphatase PhoE
MPVILLIRHGETEWNRSGRVMGDQPIPLSRAGEEQARTCAGILSHTPITAIYTSPVLRAAQTAEILRGPQKIPLHQVPGLSEIGVGDWLNRYWHELADDPAKREWYTHPDRARPFGGETLREVQQRAVAAVEQALTAHDTPIVIVSHGDVIRAVLAHYLQLDLAIIRQARIDHVAVSGLDLTGSAAQLLFLNHRPGLETLL